MTRTAASLEVRAARESDVEAIAHLAGELGYPSTPAEVGQRLAAFLETPEHAAFIAEGSDGHICGWIQLSEVRSLTSDPRAEIIGLVVDSTRRSAGIGKRLVEKGEAWARKRGLQHIGLHSNVVRERAHEFYRRLGYAEAKSQKVFRKDL